MQSDRSHVGPHKGPRLAHRTAQLAAGFALSLMAGCGSVGQSVGDSLSGLLPSSSETTGALGTAAVRGTRVAFERIEGAPPEVAQRLTGDLAAEAAARQIAVVPADGAVYRIRGYLATRERGAGTAVSWAWDVYDAGLHRAFRLGGEEVGRTAARGQPWTIADDALLRRIAQAGIEQLADFIAAGPAAPAAPEESPPLRSTVAAYAER